MRYLILMCLLARSFSSKTSTLLHSFRSRSFLTKSLLPAGPKAYSAVLSAYRCQLRPVCVSRMVGRKREWFLPRSPGCGRWSAVAGRSSRPRGSNPQWSDESGYSQDGQRSRCQVVEQNVRAFHRRDLTRKQSSFGFFGFVNILIITKHFNIIILKILSMFTTMS